MISAAGLLLLALADGGCLGFRAAAGRDARIDKRAYYRRAVGRGLGYGLAASGMTGLAAALLLEHTPDPAGLRSALARAAACLLRVFLPYAAVTIAAFALRLSSSVDIRSLAAVLLFGPLVLLRPLVAVAGVLWAAEATRRPEVLLLGALVLGLMLSGERLLGRAVSGPA